MAEAVTASCGIVAIGRNEGERLRLCLASIAPLGLPIVYVNSASTDGSRDLARAMGAHLVDLDLTLPFTAARARNAGFARLREIAPEIRFVQFVDGDCEVASDWIETALAYLESHEDVAVVCGRRRERFPDASFYNALCDAEWNTPIGEAAACGGDSCIRVAPFVEAGGFDNRMVAGEEPEMCHRLRARNDRIVRLDAAMTMHDAAMTRFGQWWMRAVRSGFGYAQVWNITRKTGEPLYGRELARSVMWAAILPLIGIALGLIVHPSLLIVPFLLWGLQLARMTAFGAGPDNMRFRWAWLMLIGKFAELTGICRYVWRRVWNRNGGTIVYK